MASASGSDHPLFLMSQRHDLACSESGTVYRVYRTHADGFRYCGLEHMVPKTNGRATEYRQSFSTGSSPPELGRYSKCCMYASIAELHTVMKATRRDSSSYKSVRYLILADG